MGFIMKTAALFGLLTAVLAAPAPELTYVRQAGAAAPAAAAPAAANPSACATVAQAFAQQRQGNQRATVKVPAAQAMACLATVPNKPEPAAKLVTSFKAYAQWESTLAYLKDPPESYGLPPVDIIGGLDNISATAAAGKFQSEYDFQASMSQLVLKAHDGHFAFRPDVFKVFTFRNDLAADMVSLSVDGVQMPKLYSLGVANGTKTTIGNVSMPLGANGLPPAITKINGQNATEFLVQQGLSFLASQDLDSQWNNQFQSYANPAALPLPAASLFYSGDSVTLEFDNGQKITQESYAAVRTAADFTGVNTGEDFYQKFLNPANQQTGTSTGTSQPQPQGNGTLPPPPPNLTGFPKPMVRDSGANVTSGYFLTGQGYDDVAVLSVIGFAPENSQFDTTEYITNFQKTVGDFMSMSKAAGKKRLVVDVSANGGGLVVAGYELYAQVFPGTPMFQANNLRRSEGLVQMATIASAQLPKIQALQPSDLTRNASVQTRALVALASSDVAGNLLPGSVFSAGGQVNYSSTEQIIAPVTLKGDQFTAYQSTPQNDTSADFNLTGTGNRVNAPAVFTAENVVLLTDGTCGSTCTLFSYLMIMQNNVKTVTVGGRPQPGPMQSVGGVEGAQVFDLENIAKAASAAMFLATPEQQAKMNGSELAILAEGYALDRAASPGAAGAVNGKNAFSHTDAQTPLQFLNQPANCKFFYTKEMVYSPEATWKRAVDAAFNDPNKFCVQGSQTPLMGVQNPSAEFFTAQAEGGVVGGGVTSAEGTTPAKGAAGVSVHAVGSGVAVVGAVLANLALMI